MSFSIVADERIATNPNTRTLRNRRVQHPRVWSLGLGRHRVSGILRLRCRSKQENPEAIAVGSAKIAKASGDTATAAFYSSSKETIGSATERTAGVVSATVAAVKPPPPPPPPCNPRKTCE
jgi:hypothetical protein